MDKKRTYINCLAFQISLARKKVHEFYEEQLKPFGLTPVYVYVLGILKDDGPCTLTHIAKVLQQERATTSNLLARMERDGFILRTPGKERRSMRVEVTQKGKEVMEQAVQTLVQADEILNRQLGGELSTAKHILDCINTTI